ncbi:MAG: PKD domain-containing protein, partial [Flavobacteriaceae bacterium]
MKKYINQLLMFKSIQRKSLIWGSFVIFSITLASNNIWDFVVADFDLQVSFTSSPADDDSDGTISICEGTTVTFTDTSTEVPVDAAYSWSFPGGNTTTASTQGPHAITFNTAGTYTVTLDINGTTSTLGVTVVASPAISPTIVTTWGTQTFNGTEYFTYCTDASGTPGWPGVFFSFLTASTNTTSNSIHTLRTGAGELIYTFTGVNYGSVDAYIEYGINTTGYGEIVYTIEEGSCVFEQSYELYVGAAPTATISNEGVPVLCFPGSVTYDISPGGQNGVGTIYTIEVSDGSDPVVFQHPPPATYTHTYNSVSCESDPVVFNGQTYYNSFEISITASNACGQSTNGFAPIYIESGPEASFEFNPDPPNDAVCQGTTLAAMDTTEPGVNITNGECQYLYRRFWQITAPDGTILTSTINGALSANPFATVVGHMGYVLGGISTSAESASSWSQNSTSQIDITFLQSGNYQVTLFTGSAGQSNRCGITQFTQTVCVTPEVIADFDLSTYLVCGPAAVTSTNNSSVTDCGNTNIYEWTVTSANPDNCPVSNSPDWEFANGTSASSFEPDFQFNTPGVYTVSLTVSLDTDTAGTSCEPDTMTKEITIKEKPQTTLPVVELCENESYTFDLLVYDCYAEQTATFLWDFQGASGLTVSSLTVLNPTVSFTTAGTYPYTLTLSNECGDNVLSGSIEIYPAVILTVSGPGVSCVNEDIALSGTISGGTTQGTWTSSVTGGSFSPSATDLITAYTPPTDYTGNIIFTLTSDDPDGPCPAVSDTVTVDVQPEATAEAGTYDPYCVNTAIQLAGTIGGAASSATWTADVTGVFSEATDLNATFTPDANFVGTITFTLTTNDPAGPCLEATDQATVEVIALGQVDTISNAVYCNADTTLPISFSTTQPGSAFSWINDNTSIGLAANGTGDISAFTAVNIGNSPVVATIVVSPTLTSGATSCSGATETFTITVYPTPNFTVQPEPTQTVCLDGATTALTVSVQNFVGTATYQWYSNTVSSDTGGTLIVGATSSSYTPLSATTGTKYYYCVVSFSDGGCTSITSALGQVTVVPDVLISTEP